MLLAELSNAIGVSGDEGAVRRILQAAIREHVAEMWVDSMGNLLVRKPGTGETKLRVMLDAHMDEVGFMVTGIENSGLLRFVAVGGVDDRILPAMRVKVGKKQLPGVVMWPPIHRNKDQNVKSINDLRIDIGATSKSQAEGKVKLGERVAFDSAYMELSEHVVRGKAFDDRVGCSLLVDVLQGGPYPVDIVASFSVQEEIGLRGAKVAAQALKPDVALALEGTTAHDLPDPDAGVDELLVKNPGCKMGHGPVITVMDRSMIPPPQWVQLLVDTAQSEGIPYQFKTALGGGTDGGAIHQTNGGVPTAVLSMPCRYIHSPAALLDKRDYAAMLRLVQATLHAISPALIAAK